MKILLFVVVSVLGKAFAQNSYTIQKEAKIYDLPGGDFLTAKHINNKTHLTHIGQTGNVIWEDSLAFQINLDTTYFSWIAGFKNSTEYIVAMMSDLTPNTFPWIGNDNDTLVYQFSKLNLSTHQFTAHLIDTFQTQGITRPIEFSENAIILTPANQTPGVSPLLNLASISLDPTMLLTPIAPTNAVVISPAAWSPCHFDDTIYMHQSQEFLHTIGKYNANFDLLQENFAEITTGEDINRAFYQKPISFDSLLVFTQGTTSGNPYTEWRMDWRKMDLTEINHETFPSPIIPNTTWNYRTSFDKIAVDKTTKTIMVLANEEGADNINLIQKIFIYDYSFNFLCEIPITLGKKSSNTLIELNNRVYLKTVNFTNSELILVTCEMADIIENIYESELWVYPNPTADMLYFEVQGTEELQSVALFDLNGKQKDVVLVSSSMDMKEVPSGIYIAEVLFTSGRKQTIRVVKE
jgi:hypothetical protein